MIGAMDELTAILTVVQVLYYLALLLGLSRRRTSIQSHC
jgi:hypothetical protein